MFSILKDFKVVKVLNVFSPRARIALLQHYIAQCLNIIEKSS